MATLGEVDLGTIQTESQTKDSNLFFTPLPYTDSADAFLLDLMGTSRTISLSGFFVNTVKATLKESVEAFEAIQDGKQTGSEYIGDFITTPKNVFIQTFTWDWEKADVGRITYNMTLLEGSA